MKNLIALSILLALGGCSSPSVLMQTPVNEDLSEDTCDYDKVAGQEWHVNITDDFSLKQIQPLNFDNEVLPVYQDNFTDLKLKHISSIKNDGITWDTFVSQSCHMYRAPAQHVQKFPFINAAIEDGPETKGKEKNDGVNVTVNANVNVNANSATALPTPVMPIPQADWVDTVNKANTTQRFTTRTIVSPPTTKMHITKDSLGYEHDVKLDYKWMDIRILAKCSVSTGERPQYDYVAYPSYSTSESPYDYIIIKNQAFSNLSSSNGTSDWTYNESGYSSLGFLDDLRTLQDHQYIKLSHKNKVDKRRLPGIAKAVQTFEAQCNALS